MMPDIKTVMLLYLIINIINTGAVAVIWRQNRGRFAGISFWLVGLAMQAAGPLLMVLRGLIPDFISMTGSNTIVLAGTLIIFMGLERFTGKRGGQVHNYILLAVFIAVSAYFVVVQPNLMARDIAVTVVIMIFTFQCSWLLLRRADPGIRQITRLAGIVFAVYSAFSLIRITLTFIFPDQSNDFFKSGPVNALAMTGYTLLNICLTISLVLMVNRRLLVDVKSQEEKFTTAFQSSPYGITLTSMSDGTIFEANDGFVNIMGYRYDEVIRKTTLGLHIWAREADRQAVVSELAQGREVHAIEYQFRKKTGEALTGLFSANLVTINNEKCILSSIGDITIQRGAEEALKVGEKKYRDALQSIIVAMSKFNESRDPYTTSHEHRVTELTCAIAAGMGLPQEQIGGIRLSSYIHDSGKLALPLEILMYRGKLTEMQMSLVRAHPQNAYNILVDIEFPWPIAITVWQHHERLDGSGYPQGLRGGDIILEARILAVADVVEAMASARPYRPALGIDKALEEISNGKGKLYDPAVVDVCLKLFKKEGFEFTEPAMPEIF
ncbi:MAG: PAS domain S-box protein [Chloroflexi bacterium]|nr:PAS domain S-box protein [Chloroflexota bacterium]